MWRYGHLDRWSLYYIKWLILSAEVVLALAVRSFGSAVVCDRSKKKVPCAPFLYIIFYF